MHDVRRVRVSMDVFNELMDIGGVFQRVQKENSGVKWVKTALHLILLINFAL